MIWGSLPNLNFTIKVVFCQQKAYQFSIEASNMKLSLVLFVLSMVLYVAHVRAADSSTSTESSTSTTDSTTTESTTESTTSSSSSSSSGSNKKIVRLSNLKYSITRKIRVGSTTSSSTRSKSSRAKSRKARLNAAKRSKKAANRKLNKKSKNRNVRVVRG